jgi:hypothetical protein
VSDSDGASGYLGESYWPGVNEHKFAVAAHRLREAESQLRHEGSDVEFVASILMLADETVFCLFEGRGTDVRALTEQAGVAFDRLLPALRIDGRRAFRDGDEPSAAKR